MLIAFRPSPEAICESRSINEQFVTQQRIISIWRKYGVLCHESPTWKDSMLRKVIDSAMGPDAARLWKKAVANPTQYLRLPARPHCPGDSSQPVGDDDPRLVFISESEAAGKYRLESTAISEAKDGVEFCRASCCDQAQAVLRMENSLNQGLKCGDSLNLVWRERFAPLVRESRTIQIVDRYVCKQRKGFEDFLKRVGTVHPRAGRRNVRVYAELAPQDVGSVRAWLSGSVVQSLIQASVGGQGSGGQFVLYRNDPSIPYGDVFKARFFEFDGERRVTLDHGTEAFARTKIKQAHVPFAYQVGGPVLKIVPEWDAVFTWPETTRC